MRAFQDYRSRANRIATKERGETRVHTITVTALNSRGVMDSTNRLRPAAFFFDALALGSRHALHVEQATYMVNSFQFTRFCEAYPGGHQSTRNAFRAARRVLTER